RGHPVVAPLAPWLGLDPGDHDGPMRDLIDASGVPVRRLPVADAAVVRDFDRPPAGAAPGTRGGAAD
ncbi:hypothetical protein HGA89_01385, partial [bacterium]|nr:hypothetical protein [bacterium]